jgi:uncharacterized protein (DUF1800 family)
MRVVFTAFCRALIFSVGLQVGVVDAAPMAARVVDQVSGAQLGGLNVDAYEKQADGSLLWKAKRTTDAEGLVSFDLEGLGSGKTFVLKTIPYGYGATSDEITSAGPYRFWVGKLQVRVVNGTTGQAVAGQTLALRRWQADGNHTYVMNVTSDPQGWVKLDPGNFATDSYVLAAASPSDGAIKTSPRYSDRGPHTFLLGNPAVVAQLQDAQSGSGLPGRMVEAYEKLPDGSRVLRLARQTDASGQARFDLDGVSSGRRYVLRAQPYMQAVESAEVAGGGTFAIRAGKLQVSLIDGRNDQAFAWQDVILMERSASGVLAWVAKYRTDGEGRVRLDPDGLGTRTYVLRAISPVDGTNKDSMSFTQAGAFQFKVGGAGLVARVVDQVSGAQLGGLNVDAYEKQADGSLLWKAKRTTDAEGLVSFDLEGLGSGKTFVLKTIPYGYGATSDEITSAGPYRFWVGKLQVRVVNGTTGQAVAGQTLALRRWQADGNHTYVMNVTSDPQGWVKLDPGNFATDSYVLAAASPSDGAIKTSPRYSDRGPHTFLLGNPAVVAQLQDAQSGSGLPGRMVEAYEKLPDGSRVLRLARQTDASGQARFDLDGVSSGRRYVLRAQPYMQAVESAEVAGGGTFAIRAGKLQVSLIDGRNDQAFAWQDVILMERSASGVLAWVAKYRTDGEGRVRLDPDGLGTRTYVLRAISPVDGTNKDSMSFTQAGAFQFKVGGAGALIRLVDHTTEAFLSGHEIHAYEKRPDGSLNWVANRTTDAQGLTQFDLEGLGAGKTFVFKSKPYGFWAQSDDISVVGGHRLRAGTSPVTVTDFDQGGTLAGLSILAYEKRSDGTFRLEAQGIADQQGLIRFDLSGLGKSSEYVFVAVNPFGDGQDRYSAVVAYRGAYAFKLKRGEVNEPDRVPPSIAISEPGQLSKVAKGGIRLHGVADDDEGVREVRVRITLPDATSIERTATWRAESKTWFVHTGALPGNPGVVRVVATAIDRAWNESQATIDLVLINDVTPPDIVVTSHTSAGSVPFAGFVLSGWSKDDTIGTRMNATISGGGLAAPIVRDVEVTQLSGRWSMAVAPETRFTSSPVTLTLQATDGAENTRTLSIQLSPTDSFAQSWHALLRTSFGASAQVQADSVQLGVAGFVGLQLAPESLDDGELEQRKVNWPTDGTQVATRFLRDSAYSRRQLKEVMTWFWDNHFNTFYSSHGNSDFEKRETEAFRDHALGNFRSLIGESARSPAMLYTLDGRFNVMGRPNENYARELMELHSMGVTGGYTQRDVEEVARAFTGWTVKDGIYFFDATKHDTGAKLVLGQTIAAGGGQSDGEKVLDIVAAHPSTARFICRKLVTLFVSDLPVESLVTRCAATFAAQQASPDQMKQVIATILNSPEFLGTTYRGTKLKTPIEFVLGAVRQFGGENAGDDISLEIQRQGMALFMNPSPTGFGETGTSWLSTSMLQTRARFADRLLSYNPTDSQTQFNLSARMADEGFVTAEGVAGRMLEWTLGPTFLSRHRQLAIDVLTENGSYPYFPSAPDAEMRLRRLGKALMMLPEYQFQ